MRSGEPGEYGWPLVDHIDYGQLKHGTPALAMHPHDDDVYLAGAAVLDNLPADVDAVVSLCPTGRTQVLSHVEHVNFRLIDDSDPARNPNLDYVLVDAAWTIARLRDANKRVVLHGVAAHSRTPTVGTAYAMLRGVPLADALPAVCDALPTASPNGGFHRALQHIEGRRVRDWANR